MEKPMSTTETKTCTIFRAVDGACGKPAVASGKSRLTGFEWAECTEHAAEHGSMTGFAAAPADDDSVKVGDRISVIHIGIGKVGTVTKVGRVGVLVEVPIHGGMDRKVIRRRFEDIIR